MSNETTSIATRVYDVLSDAERLSMLECLRGGGYINETHKPLEFPVGEEVWVKALVVQADPNDPRELTYAVTLDDEHTQGSLVSDPFWLPASSLKALDE